VRRVFVPVESLHGEAVLFSGGEAHYLRHVLRLTPGDRFSAVLSDGAERIATVSAIGEDRVAAELGPLLAENADPRLDVRLRPALVKGRKLDLVVQKCTELGVAQIGPILCDRSVARPDPEGAAHKLERWTRIAVEAARQCGRRSPPRLAPPVAYADALAEVRSLGGTGLILAPEVTVGVGPGRPILPTPVVEPISVLVGPEGGFTAEEIDEGVRAGLRPVGLGRRVLRAETAAIGVCALLMYELGELA